MGTATNWVPVFLQKHCTCASGIPGCYLDGESSYPDPDSYLQPRIVMPPVEGEALAVVWGLEQTKYFTQGCDNLVVVADHKPLAKIFVTVFWMK